MKFIATNYGAIEIGLKDVEMLASMHCEHTHELPPKKTCMDMNLGGCCNSCAARNVASRLLKKYNSSITI